MHSLRERIAYLQGLAEGIKLEEGDQKDRILSEIIDVLADFADDMENIQVVVEDLENYLEDIEDELEDFEDEEDFEGEDLEDFDDEDDFEEAEGFIAGDVKFVEVECPKCHDIICFEEDILDDDEIIEVTCPNCNEVVFVNDGSMPLPRQKARKTEDKDEEK